MWKVHYLSAEQQFHPIHNPGGRCFVPTYSRPVIHSITSSASMPPLVEGPAREPAQLFLAGLEQASSFSLRCQPGTVARPLRR